MVNSQDDALTAGENEWDSDKHGRRCLIYKTTHCLWARMGGDKINIAVGGEFTKGTPSVGANGWISD